jgi:SAM-dependent methyltransferase
MINLNVNKFIKLFNKFNIWTKITFYLIIGLVLVYMYNAFVRNKYGKREGFTQKEKFVMKQGIDVYDDFYASIYDELVYDPVKNNFEVGELIRVTKMDPKTSIILDIGSGTGHHAKMLNEKGITVHGLDTSSAMVKKSKDRYPELNFKQGDALDAMVYPADSFTHINALYFTLYYIRDKRSFFENCYKWLKPGGYLNIHLVNRDKFNPIINAADPLVIVSPQKYAKKRITNSLVKFNDFQYRADFKYKPEQNLANFEELFKDEKTGNVRKNDHVFYMDTQKHILSQAKDAGFVLEGKIDMVYCKYEYQYIYILYKPE